MKEKIVSLLKKTVTDNNISDKDGSYFTPAVHGKIITCDKNCQNQFVFSIRNSEFETIYNITEKGDIFNKKGKELKSRTSLNNVYGQINHIADALYPRY